MLAWAIVRLGDPLLPFHASLSPCFCVCPHNAGQSRLGSPTGFYTSATEELPPRMQALPESPDDWNRSQSSLSSLSTKLLQDAGSLQLGSRGTVKAKEEPMTEEPMTPDVQRVWSRGSLQLGSRGTVQAKEEPMTEEPMTPGVQRQTRAQVQRQAAPGGLPRTSVHEPAGANADARDISLYSSIDRDCQTDLQMPPKLPGGNPSAADHHGHRHHNADHHHQDSHHYHQDSNYDHHQHWNPKHAPDPKPPPHLQGAEQQLSFQQLSQEHPEQARGQS